MITEVMTTKINQELPLLQRSVKDVVTYRMQAHGLRFALRRAAELEAQKIRVLQHYLTNA
jgi:hypothetical protein